MRINSIGKMYVDEVGRVIRFELLELQTDTHQVFVDGYIGTAGLPHDQIRITQIHNTPARDLAVIAVEIATEEPWLIEKLKAELAERQVEERAEWQAQERARGLVMPVHEHKGEA